MKNQLISSAEGVIRKKPYHLVLLSKRSEVETSHITLRETLQLCLASLCMTDNVIPVEESTQAKCKDASTPLRSALHDDLHIGQQKPIIHI